MFGLKLKRPAPKTPSIPTKFFVELVGAADPHTEVSSEQRRGDCKDEYGKREKPKRSYRA
jgi:hypothetical protein